MKITLQPTEQIDCIDGNLCRLWKGFTDENVPIDVWVICFAVPEGNREAMKKHGFIPCEPPDIFQPHERN